MLCVNYILMKLENIKNKVKQKYKIKKKRNDSSKDKQEIFSFNIYKKGSQIEYSLNKNRPGWGKDLTLGD